MDRLKLLSDQFFRILLSCHACKQRRAHLPSDEFVFLLHIDDFFSCLKFFKFVIFNGSKNSAVGSEEHRLMINDSDWIPYLINTRGKGAFFAHLPNLSALR